MLGQVFSFASGTLSQYSVVDKSANTYHLAGYYATVQRDGEDYFELYFTGDPDSPEAMSFRHQLDFKEIKLRELTASDDVRLTLIFVVPPAVTIHQLKTQAGTVDDLNYRTRRS